MDNRDCLVLLKKTFIVRRNPENAVPMEKYMKGLFPFVGIRTPERRELSKQFIKQFNFQSEDAELIIKELWEMPEREFQYVAADALVRNKKMLRENHADLLEYLIMTKSWWDTVDTIASHLVGALFFRHPHLIIERGDKWLHSESIWLQRSMVLFQLKYKDKTDAELLFSIIEKIAHKKEFFIQKAIGWSLREYSKTNSEAVIHFIETHELSNLAKREGLKHIEK
ncbi:DNA alkylation repair protein [Lederbergia lenta]|uniref:DNA-7-methylguanine glycosylase n=1 Tax=Lederbergia lenta TaxID=1467 RepID=A0A2X4VR07_LEDLE|nr:DNA alkylation repair protein [Lederbergia lenta]MEC2325979.1 DNA alkylation repair protein [Lederbergia lenta]SQI53413.1 DNA-7-methylguanine glycosylase [Lederbergia lenta]